MPKLTWNQFGCTNPHISHFLRQPMQTHHSIADLWCYTFVNHSGLDSFAALSVVGSVRRMAAQAGLVVLASIHQPSARIWALFDRITLLASGCLLYHGTRDSMLAWLGPEGLGFSYDARLHGAPSDWALDIVAIGFPKPQVCGLELWLLLVGSVRYRAIRSSSTSWTMHDAIASITRNLCRQTIIPVKLGSSGVLTIIMSCTQLLTPPPFSCSVALTNDS